MCVLPGADFGLYFFVKRQQDSPMDAMKMILAGWMNRLQQHVIDYLQEEIRALKDRCCDSFIRHEPAKRKPAPSETKQVLFSDHAQAVSCRHASLSRWAISSARQSG